MVVSLKRGPQYRPQDTLILIMGTPKKIYILPTVGDLHILVSSGGRVGGVVIIAILITTTIIGIIEWEVVSQEWRHSKSCGGKVTPDTIIGSRWSRGV